MEKITQENNEMNNTKKLREESRNRLGLRIGLIFAIVVVIYAYSKNRYLIDFYGLSQKRIQNNNIFMIAGIISASIFFVRSALIISNKIQEYRIIQIKYESILKDNEKNSASCIQAINIGKWSLDVQTGDINFNKRWSDITGYSLTELSDININDSLKYIHQEDSFIYKMQIAKIISKEISYFDIECRMLHKNGHWIWVQDHGEVISWTEDGKPQTINGTSIDITEQRKTNNKFINSTEKYKSIIEISNTGVWEYNLKNDYLWCSNAYFNILGYDPKCFLVTDKNNLLNLWTNLIHPEDVDEAVRVFAEFLKQEKVEFYDNHFRMKRKDGEWAWIWSRGKVVKDLNEHDAKYVVGTHIDVTEMKKAQQAIEFLSFRDSLTGLYNRRYYEDKSKEYNDQASFQYSLIIFDVNGLKLVNDAFGHLVGDRLLKKVGDLLMSNCQQQDIVARIGGDEFVVLLPMVDKNELEHMAGHIMSLIEKERIENIPISVSCGWASKKEKQDSVELIFKRAEDSMYHNKVAERRSLRYQSVQLIMKTLYEKIPREEAHSKRVSDISLCIGNKLKLDSTHLRNLQTAAMLHDIGKIGISNDILNKKGPLNEEEWLEIKKHPKISYNILSSVNEYGPLAEIVLSHHERWDGNGYPNRLKGEEIPLKARIIAIADAYDAMVSDRPYRAGMNEEKALEIIEAEAGKQFDPNLVELFLDLLKKTK